MNRRTMVFAGIFLASMGLGAACGEKKESATSPEKVTAQEVKKKAKEAVETAMAYTQQQREEYQKQLEGKIKEYDRKLVDRFINIFTLESMSKIEFLPAMHYQRIIDFPNSQ